MTKKELPVCPICEEGHLHPLSLEMEVEYKGHRSLSPLLMSTCDACGSEQAGMEEARANKRCMIAFRKQVDGLLTGAELKALRVRLGISQAEAATIFGGGPVAFSKYENDDVMQSEAMDKLLRVADAVPAAFYKLADAVGLAHTAEQTNIRQFRKWQTASGRLMAESYQSIASSMNAISSSTTTKIHMPANDTRFDNLLAGAC